MLQRMMGHLPMLFHPNPQQVLNIGLGAGVTFGAVSCYPAEHLEVVEFEPSVVNVAKIWGTKNHNVLDHPHVKVTINDGRNHLFTTSKSYDVITSDPFEPVMAGAANLYTVDFFELAKSKLSNDGIMAQYLPLYELSYDDYQMIMRSFAEVFPDCIIFFTGFDTILLGAKNNKSFDSSLQDVVYSLDVGVGLKILRGLLYFLLVLITLLIYQATQFHGLTSSEAMDFAQLGRNFTFKEGLVTKNISPMVIYEVEKFQQTPEIYNYPDLIHPPGYPILLSFGYKFFQILGLEPFNLAGSIKMPAEQWVIIPLNHLFTLLTGWVIFSI